MKHPIKSKTLNFSLLLVVFGAVQTLLPNIEADLGPYYGRIFMAVGVIVAVLRFVTTQPIGKEPGE